MEAIAPDALEFIRLAERAEAAACADFYRAAPPALAVRVASIKGLTVMLAPHVPVGFFNRAIGFDGAARITEADLDDVIDRFRSAGIAEFWLQLTPEAAARSMPGWLEARGFSLAPRARWAKFVRDTRNPPSARTELEIRPAGAGDAAEIASIITGAYGLPPELSPWILSLIGRPGWLFQVACTDGRAVATGALHVGGECGWLGFAATAAEYRGRGAQSALLAARIRAAAQQGCRTVTTETGEPKGDEPNPSLANIRRAGFVQVCSRLNYRREAG